MIEVMFMAIVVMALSTVIIWGAFLIIDRLSAIRNSKPQKVERDIGEIKAYVKDLNDYLQKQGR